MDVFEVLDVMVLAERKAAELILHAHGVIAETKGDARDVVTEYDLRVQQLVMDMLREKYPGAAFFCEESDSPDSLDGEMVFIIDPIDGTMNFVHGFKRSAVSIGFMSRGEILAGAVYNPYLDELFTAVKGNGARLNGREIRADDAGLRNSVVCVGTSPYRPDLSRECFDLIRRVFDHSLDIRREGVASLDLCSVAAGRAGVYCENSTSLWDYAAGSLIAAEAGAVLATIGGGRLPFSAGKTSIVCAGPETMKDFLEMAAEA